MKKTLALMAILTAGVASANDAELLYTWDSVTTTHQSVELYDLTTRVTDYDLTYSSAWRLEFTLTFPTDTADVKGDYPILMTFGADQDNCFTLWAHLVENGYDLGFGGKGNFTHESVTSNGTYNINNTQPLTYTIISSGTKTPTLELYIDGTKISSTTYNATGEVIDSTLATITFGAQKGTSDDRIAATFTDVKLYKLQAVPEPTTATLSLLALAGLAARRRRK